MPVVVLLFPTLALLASFVKSAGLEAYTINTLKLTLSSSLNERQILLAREKFQGSLLARG